MIVFFDVPDRLGDKPEFEKAAKNHVVPEVFKKFVASFQCIDSEK